MVLRDLVADARRLADVAHAGTTDKQGNPYIEHCARVAGRFTDELRQAVAWLHDTLEDTCVTESDLRDYFPDAVVDAVIAVTHLDGEPRETYYERVKANELALDVKLADIADNLDPRRLLGLPAETMVRLMVKYGKALDVLI